MKFELGPNSPLTSSRVGDVEVPRFTVWLIWLAPVQVVVTVTGVAVPVATIRSPSGLVEDPLEYWQAWVLLRIWVLGFADKFCRKLVMMPGFIAVSAAIVFSPVVVVPRLVWLLPWT